MISFFLSTYRFGKKSLHPDLPYLISLTRVPQVGSHTRQNPACSISDRQKQFLNPPSMTLEKIEGIGKIRAHSIKTFQGFLRLLKKKLFFCSDTGSAHSPFMDRGLSAKIIDLPTMHPSSYFIKEMQISIQHEPFPLSAPVGILNMENKLPKK